MRIMLDFFDHVDWSEDTIEKNIERVKKFLDDHSFEYVVDPESIDSLIIRVERKYFLEFASFLTEKLRAPLNCIHIVYQTLCVSGNGAFETIVDEEAKDFIEFAWNKKIDFSNPSQ